MFGHGVMTHATVKSNTNSVFQLAIKLITSICIHIKVKPYDRNDMRTKRPFHLFNSGRGAPEIDILEVMSGNEVSFKQEISS
jgi:hypothetical protein